MLRNRHRLKGLLASTRGWLLRVQRWRCTEETRRALAEIGDGHVHELSEIGRRLRREARRELETARTFPSRHRRVCGGTPRRNREAGTHA